MQLRCSRRATLAVLGLAACRRADSAPRDRSTPVLLVHGMFADHTAMLPIARHLRSAGFSQVEAMDLRPVDGSVGVVALAVELDRAARALRERTRAARIDVVGYSLGALVARCWLQRSGGREITRRFLSIAGPQHGVLGGALPIAALSRDLRPASPLLLELERDPDPWGSCEVGSFFSPFDAVIVPTETAILPRSTLVHAFVAPTHHHMGTDPHVLAAVDEALSSRAMHTPLAIPSARQLEARVERAIRQRLITSRRAPHPR
jgi:triacylglycerol lipase